MGVAIAGRAIYSGESMGGFGSGRNQYARTPDVRECRHLEANKFTDAVTRPEGTMFTVSWGESTVGVAVERDGGEHADALRLQYTVGRDTDAEQSYDCRVPLEYTEPNLGGVRPWFRCPNCQTRRGKLYLPPSGGYFLCRECHDLGYRSSRDSGNDIDRALDRYKKAFARADADDRRPHPEGHPWKPKRPKGMHQDTFDDLLEDVDEARREWDRATYAQLVAITERSDIEYPTPPPPPE